MKPTIEKIIHIIITLSTAGAILFYFVGGTDPMGQGGVGCFKYFTTDSNVLALVASVLCLIYPAGKRPHAVSVFRFAATTAVSVTLFTVIFFLAPMAIAGSGSIFAGLRFFMGNVFVLHFSTPVLSIAALLLGGVSDRVTKRETLWAVLPVLVYSLVYLVQVVFLQNWTDWYGFTFGGRYALIPLVMAVMYAFAYALGRILWRLER